MIEDYKPVKIVNTEILTREEWLDYRKNGIGGSDASIVCGLSPYKGPRELYFEKIGELNNSEDIKKTWVQIEVGNALEDLVAKVFAYKTGFKIFKDAVMYAHPKHNYMLANLDYFTINDKGEKCILECKTTTFHNKLKWEQGVPKHYELQCRHYMAVMNLDICYIACLYDNNENGFIYHKIKRDLKMESELIATEDFFWNECIGNRIEPSLDGKPSKELEFIKKYYKNISKKDDTLTLNPAFAIPLEKYFKIRRLRLFFQKKVDELKEREIKISLPIIDLLKGNTKAKCITPLVNYDISFKKNRFTVKKEYIKNKKDIK